MRRLTESEVANFPACDVLLTGIEWQANMALVLRFVLPGERHGLLTATLVRNLCVALKLKGGRGGYPLSWDIKYTPLPDGGWHVAMDFAHTGALHFDCAELQLE